jgi:hypothetical protein
MSRFYLSVILAVTLLCVAAVGAIAVDDESNPPGADDARISAIEPDAKEALDVLDQQRGLGDALSEDLTERMDKNASYGMNSDLSRLSIANATHSVYVLPADDHVCAALTIGEGANLSCRSTEEVADGKTGAATVLVSTGIAIYGLVPDGVGSVSVQTGTDESTRLDVENNAYYTVVPAGTALRTVRYVGPSGPAEFPIYDPVKVLEASRD